MKELPYEIVICPPFPILDIIGNSLKNTGIILGAQDCHHELSGPYTGDVSPGLLKEVGCKYVILGHSERRKYHSEKNPLILAKAKTAIAAKLNIILCIGEDLKQYNNGQTKRIIKDQLLDSLPMNVNAKNVIIAYEPIWAIGSGKVASSTHIQKIHKFIRKELSGIQGKQNSEKFRIIYGGSMNEKNAKNILKLPDVDGGLIGGASLKASSFSAIVKTV